MKTQQRGTSAVKSKGRPPKTLRDAVRAKIRAIANDEPTVSVEQAGRLLGLKRDAVYEALRRGTLPGVLRLGGRSTRVSVAALEAALLGE